MENFLFSQILDEISGFDTYKIGVQGCENATLSHELFHFGNTYLFSIFFASLKSFNLGDKKKDILPCPNI